MTNEEWNRVLDGVPHEARASFEAMRGHFGDVYSGTLQAFLHMLGGVETKLDTAIAEWQADTNDRKQIAIGLDFIIVEIGTLRNEVQALRIEVSTVRASQVRSDKARVELGKRLDKIEKDLKALQARVASLQATQGA